MIRPTCTYLNQMFVYANKVNQNSINSYINTLTSLGHSHFEIRIFLALFKHDILYLLHGRDIGLPTNNLMNIICQIIQMTFSLLNK